MPIPRKPPKVHKQVTRERKQISIRLPSDLIQKIELYALELSALPPYTTVTASDVVRLGLIRLFRAEPNAVPEKSKPCIVAEVGEKAGCIECGLQWTTGQAPECPALAAPKD